VSTEIWYSEDVQQIILAAAQANDEVLEGGLMGTDAARTTAYHHGYRAALSTMALALGLPTLPPADSNGESSIVNSAVSLTGDSPSTPMSGAKSRGLAAPPPSTREESSYADRPAVV
jgi:hypothetical protein